MLVYFQLMLLIFTKLVLIIFKWLQY